MSNLALSTSNETPSLSQQELGFIKYEASRLGVDAEDFIKNSTVLSEIRAINEKYNYRLEAMGVLAQDKEFVSEVEGLRSKRLHAAISEIAEQFLYTRKQAQSVLGLVNE